MFAYIIKIEFSLCFSFELARHKKTVLQYNFRCINTIFVQTSVISAGNPGSIPGWESSPEEGKGYPLQYSGLENSMGCIVHGVAKSQTQWRNFHLLINYQAKLLLLETCLQITEYHSAGHKNIIIL